MFTRVLWDSWEHESHYYAIVLDVDGSYSCYDGAVFLATFPSLSEAMIYCNEHNDEREQR